MRGCIFSFDIGEIVKFSVVVNKSSIPFLELAIRVASSMNTKCDIGKLDVEVVFGFRRGPEITSFNFQDLDPPPFPVIIYFRKYKNYNIILAGIKYLIITKNGRSS